MAEHVCPVWMGWWLASPVRRLFQDPEKILGPFIREGMRVLEPGSAMGFYSLPAARLVGPSGKVISVDLQPGMIKSLKKRATKAGLADRIEARLCDATSLRIDDLKGAVDFAFAIAVVHEVPDAEAFFRQIAQALKPDGKFLFVEPKGHVTAQAFAHSIRLAEKTGFKLQAESLAYGGRVAVMNK